VVGNAIHLTLREMRQTFASPRVLAAMLILGVLLGLVGPFATFDYFRPIPRIAYWIGMVFFGYAAGTFGGSVMVNIINQIWKSPNVWVVIFGAGTGAGIPVSIVVYIANSAILGDWDIEGFSGILTTVYCILISICIAALHILFLREDRPSAPKSIEILSRLQVQNRGTLLYLSMQDHYVNVVTSRGQELLLMRMSDAIKEADGIEGIKIHRSHWVAIDGVKRVERQNGNYLVEMLDSQKLPVSRGQVQAAKDAGIIT